MKVSAALALLLLFLTPELHAQEAPQGSRKLILSGQVFDQATRPLPDVRVGLRGSKRFVRTDNDGRFALDVSAEPPLKKDASNAYGYVEFDKDGYLGQTVPIEGLSILDRSVTEILPPIRVTEGQTEFTARMSMNHTLPPISPDADFSLISPLRWKKYFLELEARHDTDLTEQVLFQAYVPKHAKRLKAVFLLNSARHRLNRSATPSCLC